MRQAGMIAAACRYAMENNVSRLKEDHRNARQLAAGLATIPGINCDPSTVDTNMVFIELESDALAQQLSTHLADRGIAVLGGQLMRLVTHMDISREAIDTFVAACEEFYAS